MIKSTVVIPNYNGIKYIEACLDSLFKADKSDIKVIMIDNASKDGSLELVREKYPQVKLIVNEENLGFAEAVNQGILASDTEYVILLNNDTEVDEHFIDQLELIMDQDASIFSASAKMISLKDKTKIDDAGDFYNALGWAFAKGKGQNPELFNEDYPIFSACAGAAIYRKELFDTVGLFDENHFAYFEDVDIGYRARICGYKNMFASKAIVYHAGSATSGSRYNSFKTKIAARNSIYLVRKNMPILQRIINLPFLLIGFMTKAIFFILKGYGKEYIGGFLQGFKLSNSKSGKSKVVRFKRENVINYCTIQLELWANLLKK